MKKWLNILYRYKVHHLLLWAGYFAFWMSYYGRFYPSVLALFVVVAIYFVFNAAPFYLIGYYLLPRYFYQRRYLHFAGWCVVALTVSSLCLATILYLLFAGYVSEELMTFGHVAQLAFISVTTIVAGLSGLKIIVDRIRFDKQAQQMDKQRLESELQYLKAQVNPHFLFNAINSVYFLIKKNPDQAADTLIRLSDLLRFQLYDCSGERIPIEKELEYLRNFVALEQIRKGGKVKVNFDVTEGTTGFAIAPFLLIPFMENAFKHVSTFSEKDNFIQVVLTKEGSQFKASLRNTSDNLVRYEVGGIGLKNVKRRLDLLYPDKHLLLIKEENGIFEVALTLQIE